MAVWLWLCLWSPIPSFLLQSSLISFPFFFVPPSHAHTLFGHTHTEPFLSPFSLVLLFGFLYLFIRCLQTIRLELPFSTLLSLLIIINLAASFIINCYYRACFMD